MATSQTFEPVEAMEFRAQLGDLLDRVAFHQQRFIIQRRGKPKALLVPLTDQGTIEGSIHDEKRELEAIYSGFMALRGVIDDPHGRDASQTIDEYLYGYDRVHREVEDHEQ
jgi:prevent-host-death family protein